MVIQFVSKETIEREALIRQARENYESIFPTVCACELCAACKLREARLNFVNGS